MATEKVSIVFEVDGQLEDLREMRECLRKDIESPDSILRYAFWKAAGESRWYVISVSAKVE